MVKIKIVKINKPKGKKSPCSIVYLVASHRMSLIELYKYIYFGDGEEPDLQYTLIDKGIYLALNELAYEDGFLV